MDERCQLRPRGSCHGSAKHEYQVEQVRLSEQPLPRIARPALAPGVDESSVNKSRLPNPPLAGEECQPKICDEPDAHGSPRRLRPLRFLAGGQPPRRPRQRPQISALKQLARCIWPALAHWPFSQVMHAVSCKHIYATPHNEAWLRSGPSRLLPALQAQQHGIDPAASCLVWGGGPASPPGSRAAIWAVTPWLRQ